MTDETKIEEFEREKALGEREQTLAVREKALAEGEQALTERTQALDAHEQNLNERAAIIGEHEHALEIEGERVINGAPQPGHGKRPRTIVPGNVQA